MKVLFASGGSGGPVAPLLAIYEELKQRESNLQAVWIGTANGPEQKMIKPYQIDFRIISNGKLRRYFSLRNLIDPFFIFIGFIQSLLILKKERPDIVLTCGSFVAVPVAYAARLLKIPVFIHQQDLQKGFANKLMQVLATKITITFNESFNDYPKNKTVLTGNPIRKAVFNGNIDSALKYFNLQDNKKTMLIFGGGQGSQTINQVVLESLGQLTKKYQIIHSTGKNTITESIKNYYDRESQSRISQNYRAYEFLNKELFDAYALADLVIGRAGISSLTELAVLAKPALLIPIPGHQEYNTQYFAKYNAIKVINQKDFEAKKFVTAISELLENEAELKNLANNITQLMNKDAALKYVDLIYKVLK